MSSYNLLDEKWIPIIAGNDKQEEVSLLQVFAHAQEYRRLAGDMETQNFALLRFLLAIIQTVFSRYDSEGNPIVEVDDVMRQTEAVDEDDLDDYEDEKEDTWDKLWEAKRFPGIVTQYLEKWRGHFYLYDDKFPFYQITEKEMEEVLPDKKKATSMAGKNFNRLISESGNKTALFSPVGDGEGKNQKDRLSSGELARWLIMLQGYIGLSDKVSLTGQDQKPSKGWLFDIGGLFLEGSSLYETLMMNYIPVHSFTAYNANPQSPCWEKSGKEVISALVRGDQINNLADLYTNWSRAVYIDSSEENKITKQIKIIKLPAIEHQDNFLEPMTIWHFNKSGDYKDRYTPQKHKPDQAMWRNFGLILLKTLQKDGQHRPEILEQMIRKKGIIGERRIIIHAVGMQDDGNATSWVPVDEMSDSLNINDLVISDDKDSGWIVRINEAVHVTKEVADCYRRFITDIADIRKMDPKKEGGRFADSGREDFYQRMNAPFREWLAGIHWDDSKDGKVLEWYKILKTIAKDQAQQIVRQASTRDYKGVDNNGHILNVVTAYQMFLGRLKQKIG